MKPIHIFATGGTIDKVYFDANNEFQIGEPQIRRILEESNVSEPYQIEAIIQKDSLQMTDGDRLHLFTKISHCDSDKIVVTHGTDTMVESAKCCGPIRDKTIVFTGAMQPALFRSSDATFNVATAFVAAQILPPGVYIVINGKIFDPESTIKNYDTKAFELK